MLERIWKLSNKIGGVGGGALEALFNVGLLCVVKAILSENVVEI